jgi:hypothetical protein
VTELRAATAPAPVMEPPRQREPVLVVVGRLQAELGIREPAPVEGYGPTSALSEELLLHGYRNAGEDLD